MAAARADGGVNRSARGAKVFANIKTVIRTCHKQGLNFFDYARQVMRATLTGLPPPLLLATADVSPKSPVTPSRPVRNRAPPECEAGLTVTN